MAHGKTSAPDVVLAVDFDLWKNTWRTRPSEVITGWSKLCAVRETVGLELGPLEIDLPARSLGSLT